MSRRLLSRSPLRHALPVGLALLLVPLWHAPRAPAATAPPSREQLGIFTTGRDAHVDAVLAGIHAGLRLAGLEPDMLEKTAAGDSDIARATVEEFAFEGTDVVFAIGADAAMLARDALRSRSVVFAGVGYPEAHGLPGRGNVCGVAGGVPPAEIVEWMRRVAPAAERLGTLGGDRDAFVLGEVARIASAEGIDVIAIARAADVAGADCDAVWLAPGVSDDAAAAIARALAGRHVALIGSRRGHLDAGCSVAIRTDPAEQGLHAAALAQRVLAGRSPQRIGVRRIHRRRLEINLDAARRLRHELPLPVLAAADHLAPALGRRR